MPASDPPSRAGNSVGPVPDFATSLARGTALFNEQRFFEAHEVWEDRWRVETGEAIDGGVRGGAGGPPADGERAARALLLHGLIQIAAGFVKLQRGEPRGMVALLSKGAAKLERVPVGRFPVDIVTLLDAVGRWLRAGEAMLAGGTAAFDPAALPRLDTLRGPGV